MESTNVYREVASEIHIARNSLSEYNSECQMKRLLGEPIDQSNSPPLTHEILKDKFTPSELEIFVEEAFSRTCLDAPNCSGTSYHNDAIDLLGDGIVKPNETIYKNLRRATVEHFYSRYAVHCRRALETFFPDKKEDYIKWLRSYKKKLEENKGASSINEMYLYMVKLNLYSLTKET